MPALGTELQRAAKHEYPLALALLAIDAFRKYVDTYGIDQAHALLAEVVEIVKSRIRDIDILARFGADEFILCLSGVNEDESRERLAALRDAITNTAVGQGDFPIGVTVGALALEGERDMKRKLQDILGTLGHSLVAAKDQGSNQLHVSRMEHS